MITPGLFNHYKGAYYRVLFIAKNSNNSGNDENVVVYVSLSEPGRISVRDEAEFDETITPLIDGSPVMTKRFTRIGD
jgi:hypothetical protein